MSLKRYTQPKRVLSCYVPKKNVLMQTNRIQSTLPKLIIPNKLGNDNNNRTQNKKIYEIISCNSNIKKSYKPDVDNELSKFVYISANKNIITNEVNIPPIPSLPSPCDPNFNQIFAVKIKICNMIFDFSKNQFQIREKKIKSETLVEINDLLSKKSEASLLTNQQKDMIYKMIIKNIYDQDPFVTKENICPSTVKWDFCDRSWPHLKLVYQILLQFIYVFPDLVKIDLIKKTIRLLNIPVNEERDCLISFIKCYYSIHPNQLDEIWGMIKNALCNVISQIYTPYCVEPILIFISGSVRPDYLIKIFHTHLLPLFRLNQLYLYSNRLSELIFKIAEKSMILQTDAIEFLIKYFPYQCGQKQFLFISALHLIFDEISGNDLGDIASKLINFLKITIRSSNNKLAESAVKLLLSPTMSYILLKNISISAQPLYDSLNWSSLNHWGSSVKNACKKALAILGNINSEVQKKKDQLPERALSSRVDYSKSNLPCKPIQDDSKSSGNNKELISKWALIARNASKMDNSIDLTKSLLLIQEKLLNEQLEPWELESQFAYKKNIPAFNSLHSNLYRQTN